MSTLEILFVLGGLVYEVFFIAYAIVMFSSGGSDPTIIPLFALALFFGLAGAFLVSRDLAIRKFASDKSESDHARMKWSILISSTFGIGLVVYLLKHAAKPRQGESEGQPQPSAEASGDDGGRR